MHNEPQIKKRFILNNMQTDEQLNHFFSLLKERVWLSIQLIANWLDMKRRKDNKNLAIFTETQLNRILQSESFLLNI